MVKVDIEGATNRIGKMTTAGLVEKFSLPMSTGYPLSIVNGLDGNLWFGEVNENKIGTITLSGVTTEYDIPTNPGTSYGVVSGPDGNIWFTETSTDKIGKLTPCS